MYLSPVSAFYIVYQQQHKSRDSNECLSLRSLEILQGVLDKYL